MMIQYRITEDDYASAARFHAWRRFTARPSSTLLVAGGIMVGLVAIGVWIEPEIVQGVAFFIALFAILLAVRIFVRIPRRARWQYRRYKEIQEPVAMELTEAGIKFSATDVEGILRWSKVFQWRQNDRLVLIYSMPILFHIIPKSIEHEGFDIALLVQRLIEHVGPER